MALSRPLSPPAEPRLEDEAPEVGGLDQATLEQARLVDADLSGARLKGLRLIDVVIARGNLANLVAPEPLLRRVTVTGARLTGVQWTRGTISAPCSATAGSTSPRSPAAPSSA